MRLNFYLSEISYCLLNLLSRGKWIKRLNPPLEQLIFCLLDPAWQRKRAMCAAKHFEGASLKLNAAVPIYSAVRPRCDCLCDCTLMSLPAHLASPKLNGAMLSSRFWTAPGWFARVKMAGSMATIFCHLWTTNPLVLPLRLTLIFSSETPQSSFLPLQAGIPATFESIRVGESIMSASLSPLIFKCFSNNAAIK